MPLSNATFVVLAIVAAVALALTGCVSLPNIYRSINWPTVVLIASILPLLLPAMAVTVALAGIIYF